MEFKPSEEIVSRILDRLKNELQASFHYQTLSNWCDMKGYVNFAKFYRGEADSEIEHSRILQSYLNGWNIPFRLPKIEIDTDASSLQDSIEQSLEIEKALYSAYNSDALFAASKDISAFDLFSKMVEIQKESVFEYITLLDRCKNSCDLFMFDNEVFENE
jgi:ferritin